MRVPIVALFVLGLFCLNGTLVCGAESPYHCLDLKNVKIKTGDIITTKPYGSKLWCGSKKGKFLALSNIKLVYLKCYTPNPNEATVTIIDVNHLSYRGSEIIFDSAEQCFITRNTPRQEGGLTALANRLSGVTVPYDLPVYEVEGVVGEAVEMPCDISVRDARDALHMVLWFRESDGETLYNYDVRGGQYLKPKSWSASPDFYRRVKFRPEAVPAHLILDKLTVRDEGLYKCRVDFSNSPTRNSKVNLTIIVPPEQPVIYNKQTVRRTSKVESYREGSDVNLVCEVSGGRPKPNVTWYLDNKMIDYTVESVNTDLNGQITTINELLLPNVGRREQNSTLLCQASNTNLTPPTSKSIMLDINLKPIFVNITNKNKTISADKRYSIECVASGSRPEAVITWWKGSKQIKKLAKNFSKPGDTTVSILTLEPTMEDDGKNLTCRAENPIITNSALEDKWQLHVHYMPVVTLKMGSTLNPNDIKEGDDVYFECNVRANPKAHRLVWYHDGEEIHHNVSDGTILSDRSLVLQGVSRRSAGQYTCMAANSEGKGKSDPVQLQVMYAPVCLSELDELVGAVREETVQLRCEVDANPASVLFTWTFNNSGDLVQLPPHKYTTGTNAGTVSRLNYTPVSDMDYGTLSCWGRNSVGTQALPCLFQVVAAGRPLPLVNCSVSNLTVSYLRVECEESFDGGLPQSFLMEVLKLPSLELQFNVSSPRPQFDWHAADLFSSYRILLFSYNSKGRSEPVILEAVALKGVAKFTGSRGLHISSVLAGFATVCLALVVVACALLVAAYRKRKMEHGSQVKLEPVNTSCPGVLLIPNNSCQEHKSADDNPDIIPNQYEKRPLKSFMKIYKTPPQKRKKKDQECVEQTKAVDENYSNFSHSVIVTSKSNQFTNYVFNSNSSSKLNRLGSPVSPGDISNVGSFRSSSSQKLGPEVVTATHRLQESCI